MSRVSELINCVKIYNLCNHCDHFKCRQCSVDNVNCKEEIEKQIVTEIRADAIDECIEAEKTLTNYYDGCYGDHAFEMYRKDSVDVLVNLKE